MYEEWIEMGMGDVTWWNVVIFGVLGACIGSFMNVVIYRLPRGLSINKPLRSICPTCGAAIPWYHNIPIISWLVLRGQSVCCKKNISVRYFLVELASTLLFASVAYCYDYETILAILFISLWTVGLLGMLVMDWIEMVVHPKIAYVTALCGLTGAALAPQLVEATTYEPWEGLLWGCVGIFAGYVIFRFVALVGRILFGRREYRFNEDERWILRQKGDDICLTIGGREFLWSHVFSDAGGSLTLQGAYVDRISGEVGDIHFTEATICVCGKEYPLEQYEELSGAAGAVVARRAAMGSGDAWVAMTIGALCGWQGVVFSLVVGSFIGLAMAVIMRVRRGQPMPFGPALILAAYIRVLIVPLFMD